MTPILILGAGGHGRSVLEALQVKGRHSFYAFVDDGTPEGTQVLGAPVVGNTQALASLCGRFPQAVVAIGDNFRREELCAQLLALDFELAVVVHPRAFVSPSAILGPGTAVMANATVGTEARLGVGTIVNSGAVVDHHAVVEDFGHLGVNAAMAGGSVLGKAAWMQAGSSLGYGVVVPAGTRLRPGQAMEKAE